jgi:predicted dehydrogenase
MGNDKIRVGIIGAGDWAKYGHIPTLQTLKEFEVVAVSSRKQETAEKTAVQFNIPHVFGNEQALIDHPDVDLVAVVAPLLNMRDW